jgi:hypothetical protein
MDGSDSDSALEGSPTPPLRLRNGKPNRKAKSAARDEIPGHRITRSTLLAFAGIWTEFRGDRGTKSKPDPGTSPRLWLPDLGAECHR